MTIEETRTDWMRIAGEAAPQGGLFIDGQYGGSATGEMFATVSPVNGRKLRDVASCDSTDVDRAVASARRAFEDGRWSMTAPRHRKRVLLDFANGLRRERERLAVLITADCGKPISAALDEVEGAANILDFYGEAIDKLAGEVMPSPSSALALVTREPVGVVAAVVPWNFPLGMPMWKIAPALAAGNSVIVKPAEQAPLVAIALGQIASEAGIPDGVLSIVPGLGGSAGAALGLHMDVDKIAFTGSTEVGKLFLEYAGRSNLKAVSLECGGKSANIVLRDAPDLARAAAGAALAAYFNQGEMCSNGTRLVAEESIHDELLEMVVTASNDWRPADPFAVHTKVGAIVDEKQLSRIARYVDIGKSEGARLVTGGELARTDTGGFYHEPTIFSGVDNGMRIAQEEIFGPVLSVIRAKDVDHAVRIANDSRYGLAAAVWTRDLAKAHKVSRALRAGTVWINCYNQAEVNVPFGGYKQSGFGRDKSLHALTQYTQLKTSWFNLDA